MGFFVKTTEQRIKSLERQARWHESKGQNQLRAKGKLKHLELAKELRAEITRLREEDVQH